MQSIPRSLALLVLIAATHTALGQISTNIQVGKPEKPVVGLPFTADQTVRSVRHLANGMAVTREMKGHLCRSADGVERYEGTFPSTDPAKPDPTTMVFILDRAKRTSLLLNSTLKTAVRQTLPDVATVTVTLLPLQTSAQDRQIKLENLTTVDLEKKTMGLMEIRGKLITGNIPAGKVGNDQSLPVTAEVWVAPQLKLIVRQIDKNPLSGDRTLELGNIRAEEPDPTLFQIPDAYKVTDRTPIPTTRAQIQAHLGDAPEQRTKQIQDALNDPDPEVKNNVAFGLAFNGDHLTDAETLAIQYVQIVEQKTADVVSAGDLAKSFAQMLSLSRAWGTLGFVYYRQGKQDKAEAFTLAAWRLNPNELFCQHLGRIYEAQLRPKDAVAFYRMALNTKNTGAEQDLLLTRLEKLGSPAAEPLTIDITTPLPSLDLHPRAGDAGLLVDILLAHDTPPAVILLKGDPGVQESLAHAIQSALANDIPDRGPEQTLRRARVACTVGETPACALHFVGSAEAAKIEAPPPIILR